MFTLQSSVCTQENISYADIPGIDFFESYQYLKGNTPFLKALKRYKSLDSTRLENLEKRILLLRFLSRTLNQDSLYENGILSNITKKINHLTALQTLFNRDVFRNKKELYNPLVERIFHHPSSDLLSLQNGPIYDFQTNRMFGMYILEALDPAHRFGLIAYVNSWKKSASKLPFFLYLEKHCHHDSIPQVLYYSDEQLKQFQIVAKDHLLHDQGGKPLSTSSADKEFIFILDANDQLYGTYNSSKTKHTSLSRGAPLKSAGFLKITEGVVQEMGLSSGHYFPTTDSIHPMVDYFQEHDIPIHPNIPVHYHENFLPKTTYLKDLRR